MRSDGRLRFSGSLLVFFPLTFLATWTLWFAADALTASQSAHYPAPGFATLLFYIGVFAPALVALLLTALDDGRKGVRGLLAALFKADVGLRWYAFAIGFMASIKLIAATIYRVRAGEWPAFGDLPWFLLLAATIFSTVVGGQAGEELGWRGYALPRLGDRLGLGPASVLLGVIWACWHLPLFFIPGLDTTGASFPLYLLQVTALSVAIAWLYRNTGGSLLLTMLMHSAINNTTEIVPSVVQKPPTSPFGLSVSPIGWITAGLLWIFAAYFLVSMRTSKAAAVSAQR